jgi:hypothetical protein
VTARDRTLIVAALVVVALVGFWFVGLAPKRKEAAGLSSQISVANGKLAQAQKSAEQARQAKGRYDADYAAIATLGKAVPKSDALPSLLYQLQSAAHDARIDFGSLKVNGAAAAAAPAPTPAAATAAAAKSANPAAPAAATPAAATQAASAALPPGASVGAAGFPTMPFSFVFDGSFFDMESFLHDVQQFVRIHGDKVDVRGRLLSVDGFALTAGPKGFPDVKASISATAYLLAPGDQSAASGSGSTSNGAPASPTASSTPAAASSEVAR